MSDLLVTAHLPSRSGMAEDEVVNTFAFSYPAGDLAEHSEEAAANVAAFYNVVPAGGASAPSAYLSPTLSRTANACVVRVYDITGKLANEERLNSKGQTIIAPPRHGSPIHEELFTLGNALGAMPSLPREVASVITLRGVAYDTVAVEAPDGADLGAKVDRPRQRHSGRIFFGPLNTGAWAVEAGTDDVRPSGAFRADVLWGIRDLADRIDGGTPGARLCVWSRADGFLYTVVACEMDNAFDTQRRRGSQPTFRDSVAVTH